MSPRVGVRPAAAAFLALACLSGSPAEAGTGQWVRTGPDGAMARELAVTPADSMLLWLGTQNKAVFRSTDGGATWAPRSAGLPPDGTVSALAADPGSSSVAWVSVFSGPTWIFRTTDGGASWQPFQTAEFNGALDLATHPSLPGTVFGAANGIFRSDSGGSWMPKNQGLTPGGAHLPILHSVVIAPSNPAILYTGGQRAPGAPSLFRSTDSAENWSPADSGLPPLTVLVLAVDPTNPDIAYAGLQDGGVYKTLNGGGAWTPMNSGLTNLHVRSLSIDPSNPGRVFAGTLGGLFRSTNGGMTWSPSSAGIPFRSISDLDFSPSGAVLHASTSGGVFQSTNGGDSFVARNAGLTDTVVTAMTRHPVSPSVVYMAVLGQGVHKSSDAGLSWQLSSQGLLSTWLLDLAVDPNDHQIVYAATFGAWLHRSLDGGLTWAEASNGITDPVIYTLAAGPPGSGVVFAGTQDDGLFKTTNGGASWEPVVVAPFVDRITALAVDPRSAAVAYVGTPSTVYKTVDGGASWTQISNGLPASEIYRDIAVDPFYSGLVLAANDTGIFRTVDGGSSWTSANTVLPPIIGALSNARAVEYDLGQPGVAYAASAAGGVFRTINGGAMWHPFNDGLNETRTGVLEMVTGGSRLLAGTSSGVFRRDLPAPGMVFHTVPPCRIVDTREPGSGGPLPANTERTFGLLASCGIPAGARAVALNATVVGSAFPGHVTLFGEGLPATSTVNYRAGQTRANFVILGTAPGPAIRARPTQAGGDVHLILDVSGYFE